MDIGTSNYYRGIAYGNETFVLAGSSGNISTSSDGSDWTSRTSGTSEVLYSITYGKSTFVTVGALTGFYIGGRMVDKLGTKYVFFFCHFGFGAIVFLFLWRDIFPGEIINIVGILTILFGMVQAASGIAMTSERLVIIPAENKSLATGLWFTLYSGGIGLSGVLSGQILGLGLLRDSWTWFGQHMSRYDGLLLFCGTMVLLMTVTLGLIPSVIKKTPAAWIPLLIINTIKGKMVCWIELSDNFLNREILSFFPTLRLKTEMIITKKIHFSYEIDPNA